MESARINPKNSQGDYLLRPTYDLTGSNKIVHLLEAFSKTLGGKGEGGGYANCHRVHCLSIQFKIKYDDKSVR